MDKALKQLRTQVFGLCNCESSNSFDSAFNEFETKYKSFKHLFIALREKSLNEKEKENESNIISYERALEEKEKEKEKKDGDTSSIDKYLKEKLIQKRKDQSPTS